MPESATLAVPRDVLEPIIQAHVAKAISEALGGREQLIEAAVGAALNAKVDREGKPSSWNNASDPSFLQWLVRDAIRKAATEAVRAQITADLDPIKAAVAKEIKNQRSPLTKQLIEGLAKAACDAGRFKVSVTVDQVKEF